MYIGIDLGGTNIAIGLVNKEGKIIATGSTPTLAPRDYKEVVADTAKLSNDLIEEKGLTIADIQGVGIGSPGSIDSKKGVVIAAHNLNWYNAPVVDELKKYFNDIPVAIENDANAAAFGEYVTTASDKDSFLAVTLGTGVGGGIVLNKKIYRGINGMGAELGHLVINEDGVQCSCGTNGCWEAYASVTALINQTKAAIAAHPESTMAKDKKVSGRTSFNAAKAGDPVAKQVVDNYIKHIATGIISLINIFAPEVLVIGGGISNEGDYLLDPIKKYVDECGFFKDVEGTEIRIATLKNDAGIVGAAFASKM